MTKYLGPVMGDLRSTRLAEDEAELLQHPLLGGLILFSRNYENAAQLAALCADIRARRPDILLAADTEGGRVQRFRTDFTVLPAVARYGELYASDPQRAVDLAEAGGRVLASELAAFDIDLPFSPVLDLDFAVSGIIGDRAFHRAPEAVAALAQAHMRGLKEGGVATTGKHFPGHGGVAPDSHLELPRDDRDWATLWEQDMAPYRACLGQLDSVMAAHVVYPQIDALPASFSPRWLREILREELGFQGAIFADDLSMGGARDQGDIVARAEKAFAAGCDMLPVCNEPDDLRRLLDSWDCAEPARGDQRLRALRRSNETATANDEHYFLLARAGLIDWEKS